jgi:hypothetical protein
VKVETWRRERAREVGKSEERVDLLNSTERRVRNAFPL